MASDACNCILYVCHNGCVNNVKCIAQRVECCMCYCLLCLGTIENKTSDVVMLMML